MPDLLRAEPTDLLGAPMVPARSWFFDMGDLLMPNGELWDPINEDHPLVWVGTEGDQVGRVAALVAPEDACILDGRERKGRCLTPPVEPAAYDFAHISATLADDGEEVRTARLAGAIDHAGDGPMGTAQDHYANTGFGFARVRYGYDAVRGGIFALGALDPTVTVWGALTLKASSLSGDWRWVEELKAMRLAGSQVVNVPGFRPTVDRSPTRASCRYRLIDLDEDQYRSVWVIDVADAMDVARAAIVAAKGDPPKNPEFEKKIKRAPDGKFGSKPAGGSAADEALAKVDAAKKSGKIKPRTKPKSGGSTGKGAKKKVSGGKPKQTDEEKKAEADAKKAEVAKEREAKRIQGLRDDMSANSTEARDISKGMPEGELRNNVSSLEDTFHEAQFHLGRGKTDSAVKALTSAYDDIDEIVEKLAGSEDTADQERAVKLARLRDDAATKIKALGADAPISKVATKKKAQAITDARTKAETAAKKKTDAEAARAVKKAESEAKAAERAKAAEARKAEAARKKAERDAAKAAKDAAKAAKTKTAAMTVTQEEPPMSKTPCKDCAPTVIAGMELVEGPAFSYGQEVTDVDGVTWIVADSNYEMDGGVPATGLVTFEEMETYPRIVTVKPTDELTATGRIAQWKPDSDNAADAPDPAPVAVAAMDDTAGAAGDAAAGGGAAPDVSPESTADLVAKLEEQGTTIETLTTRLDSIETAIAELQAVGIEAVDLASAEEDAAA